MKYLFSTIILMSTGLSAMAQKSGIIIDNTTDIPIREVKLYTNRRSVAETDWRRISYWRRIYKRNDSSSKLPKQNDESVWYDRYNPVNSQIPHYGRSRDLRKRAKAFQPQTDVRRIQKLPETIGAWFSLDILQASWAY